MTATWNAMTGATEYQGCIDTVNDGNCNTSWQSAGTSTSWGLTNLAAGTYDWQVRALNVSGMGARRQRCLLELHRRRGSAADA